MACQSHPSTRNARSICAVAPSMSSSSLVSAAFSNSSAAKSQCGRACRNGLRRATKRAPSANVASSTPGPAVGSIFRVSRRLKLYSGAMPELCTAGANDLKHQSTFPPGLGSASEVDCPARQWEPRYLLSSKFLGGVQLRTRQHGVRTTTYSDPVHMSLRRVVPWLASLPADLFPHLRGCQLH
jgi:hypothetical protein